MFEIYRNRHRTFFTKVTNMKNMFKGAESFNQPIDGWNISDED